ncbi:MAG TPA: ABC transporter permease subunit [Clostridiales bacterium]|nr:ABC transporter permease subunit [Clostridiales bacterium]
MDKKIPVASIVKYRYLYLLLLPGVIWLIIFRYIPMYGIVIAFKDYNIFKGIGQSPWVGWVNFTEFFRYDRFWVLIRNTVLISVYKIIFGFPFPIIVALMLNEVRGNVFKRSIQTVIYFPHFLSWVIVGGLVITLLSPDGFVNSIVKALGGQSQMWIAKSEYFRGILVLSDIWKEAGWGTVVYMAALSNINVEMYEAAIIDGAARLQRIWYITIPCLMPTIVILLILRMGNVMEAGFEQVLILQNPNVLSIGDIIDTYVYRVGLEQRKYSYSAAVGLFKSIVNMILILITNYSAKKMGQESLF